MNKFYIENKGDLQVLIVNTARKKNISEAVIEKDYKAMELGYIDPVM